MVSTSSAISWEFGYRNCSFKDELEIQRLTLMQVFPTVSDEELSVKPGAITMVLPSDPHQIGDETVLPVAISIVERIDPTIDPPF